ncbi:RHS repeat-associated core domain-containing protein, partial [Pseudomonas putida]
AGQDAPQKHIVISEGGDVRVVEDRLAGTVRLRYRFADHLGSVGGETDAQGLVLAREEYAPYGGTVGCDEAAEEASNLTQRTMRYSNKERDATGLYYYGWRYYQAELGRWLSADPGGLIDGINLYRFTRNNPIGVIDTDGRGCFPSRVAKAEGAQGTHDGAPHQRTVQRAPDIDVIIREVAVSYLEHFYADQGEDGGWEYYPAEDGYSYDKFESKWRSKLKAQGLVDEQVGQVFSQGLKRGKRKAISEGKTDRRNQVKAALEDKHRRKANFPRGIKLVYATNAGAKFINGHARFVSGKGKSPGAFNNDVANDVLGGLLVAQSEFTSLGLDKKVVEDTFEELRAMGDNSERIVKAFSDALNVPGAAYNGELYRGALMTPAEISEIESTSSYEADHFLSGDRRRAVAESFATPDKHDIEFAQGRTGVLFDLSGTGALKTLDYTEIEAIHLPGTRFKAVSSGMKNGLRCFRLTRWK